MSVEPQDRHVDEDELPPPATAPCPLAALAPHWIYDYIDGARTDRIVGIKFLCPCSRCHAQGVTLAVRFAQPIGGGAPSPDDPDKVGNNKGRRWERSGEAFDNLTLSPSIDATKDLDGNALPFERAHWHGFISGGRAT